MTQSTNIPRSTRQNSTQEPAAEVEIYTSPHCGYCQHAKDLLDRKGVVYTEYGVLTDPSHRTRMLARSNGRTSVPQIFVNGVHIGGSDDLQALEQIGKLDAILGL